MSGPASAGKGREQRGGQTWQALKSDCASQGGHVQDSCSSAPSSPPLIHLPPSHTHPPLPPSSFILPSSPPSRYIMRKAFDDEKRPYLPSEVLWRQKEQFSDGVGYSW